MPAVPAPSTGNDRIEIALDRLPAQLGPRLLRGRDKHRWISRATLEDFGGNRMAANTTRRLQHLANRESDTAAEIVGSARCRGPIECKRVRARQVADMHVIPHAGAVRRRVIITKNGGTGPLAECNRQQIRDEVTLGNVVLAARLRRPEALK